MTHVNGKLNKNRKSLSITISGDPYGYGHLKRMQNLKFFLKKKKIDNLILNLKDNKKIVFEKIIFSKYNFIFLDISNKYFFKTLLYKNLIKILSGLKNKFVIFDTFEKEITNFIKDSNIKYRIVCPYILSKKKKYKSKKYKSFYGPQFILFDKIYENKNFNKKLQKIFLSCGGLDKGNFSYKISNFISKSSKDLEIHVTIGPMFKALNIKKIYDLRKKNKKIFIYNSVKNITYASRNCNLAIVSSGLSKYEMLASKINLAVFSENLEQYKYNFPFSKSKIAFDLSCFNNLDIMKKKLNYLLNNYNKIFNLINKNKEDILRNNRFSKIIEW